MTDRQSIRRRVVSVLPIVSQRRGPCTFTAVSGRSPCFKEVLLVIRRDPQLRGMSRLWERAAYLYDTNPVCHTPEGLKKALLA